MKLIGITGKASSGKDTIAHYLWGRHAFTSIAFADPLKLAAKAMFGLTSAQTWDADQKEVVIPHWGMSPRQIFQLLGTEAAKPVFGKDVWIKRWRISYDMLSRTDHIVVPDVRFDEEAEAIRGLGGVIVEVQRGVGLQGSTGTHASELGLLKLPDYVIDNNGTLEDLFMQVEHVILKMECL